MTSNKSTFTDMKKFIYKTLFFIVPFFILYIIAFIYTSKTESPDLIRLGYIPKLEKYEYDIIKSNTKIKYEELSKTRNSNFNILTIGDSFSEQGSDGYVDFLASKYKVIHIDRFISKNQIQTLIDLTNGDFFEHYKVQYVVLQNVERHIIDNCKKINWNQKTSIASLDTIIKNHVPTKEDYNYKFFSRTTLDFPLYYFPKYFLQKSTLINYKVYNVDITSNTLFSNNSNKLLFYFYDIKALKKNNKIENAQKLNSILNQLNKKLLEKNIKLIYLPSPDKYDMYYDYIADKKHFSKPLFFENMKKFEKEYIYIASRDLLSNYLNTYQDMYYYGDTHWSKMASKIIANEIDSKIKLNDKRIQQ